MTYPNPLEGDLYESCLTGNRHIANKRVTCCAMRCRVLVRAERLAEQWPTDPEFRTFAAQLADAVQRALGEGKKVEPLDYIDVLMSYCPLACLPEARNYRPHYVAGFTDQDANLAECRRQFICGFEDMSDYGGPINSGDPYYRLGQAYRKRFTPKAGQ